MKRQSIRSLFSGKRLRSRLLQKKRSLFAEQLESRQLMASDVFNEFHNYDTAQDVNRDGDVSPMDALALINALNNGVSGSTGELGALGNGIGLYDVNNDSYFSPVDALSVINSLNAEGVGELAQYSFKVLTMSGGTFPTGLDGRPIIPVGTSFKLETYVQDLRSVIQARGVGQAALDVLYSNPNNLQPLVGEVQRLRFSGNITGGTFTLTSGGQTTAPIFIDAQSTLATTLQSALSALPSIGAGNIQVRPVSASAEDPFSFDLIFRNSLASQEIPDNFITGNFANLTPLGSATGEIIERFKADPSLVGAYFRSLDFDSFFSGISPGVAGWADGLIDEATGAGGFSGSPTNPTAQKLFFTSYFKAVDNVNNTVQFASDLPELQNRKTILFTSDPLVVLELTPTQIDFTVLNVTIVKNVEAVDDSAVTNEDTAVTIAVLSNDTAQAGFAVGLQSFTQPANGVVTLDNRGTAATTDDRLIYTPNANYFGTDTFTYTVKNPTTTDGDTATVSLVVRAQNDAPTVGTFPQQTIDEDPAAPLSITTTSILATAGFTAGPANEVPPQTISITKAAGSATGGTSANGGTVTLSGTTITYTPAANFFGTDTFTVEVTDNGQSDNGAGLVNDFKSTLATISINVTEKNDAPTAVSDSITVLEDAVDVVIFGTGASINILANDLKGPANESSQTLTVLNFVPTANGSVTFVGGVARYTPKANFFGTDTISYTIQDNGTTAGAPDFKSSTGVINVTITPQNDAPVAEDDDFAVDEFSTDNILNVLANDNPGPLETGALTITAVTPAANGTVTIQNNTLVYTPNANFFGPATETFQYTVRDPEGATDTATVTVDILPIVRPRARNDRGTVSEVNASTPSPSTTFNVLSNDFANVGFFTTLLSFTQPSNGVVTLDNNNTPGDLTDDKLVYRPNNNYFSPLDVNGNRVPDTFTYTINDTKTVSPGADSTATVTITVTEVNDTPFITGVPVQATTAEDTSATVAGASLSGIFSPGLLEASQVLTVIAAQGIDSLGAPTVVGGTVTVQNGNVVYTPSQDFNGIFRFEYTVQDNGTTNGSLDRKTAKATATITITATNDAPIAVNDALTAREDDINKVFATSLILTNDAAARATAVDELPGGANAQTISVTAVSATSSQGGTVTLQGTDVLYTPAPNFNGVDTFTYTLTDSSGAANASVTGTVTVTVSEVNDAPITSADSLVGFKNFPTNYLAADLLRGDTAGPANESAQTLTIVNVRPTAQTRGTITFNAATGGFRYSPPTDYTGPDSFEYVVRDNGTTAGAADARESVGEVNMTVQDFVPSSISGTVFVDDSGDKVRGPNELRIGGVEIVLAGTALGLPFRETYITLADGTYTFDGLAPGTYTVSYSVPHFTNDGADLVGSHGDSDTLANQFTLTIVQPGNVQAVNYDFAVTGVNATFASVVDHLASNYYSRDPQGRVKGIYGAIGPQNARGWTSSMQGFSNFVYVEMVLSDDGTKLLLSGVDANERVFTTVLDKTKFVRVKDSAGNSLIRVLGGAADFTWTEVPVNAAPPVPAARYLDAIEAIFAQEEWN